MPVFVWEGRTRAGEVKKGEMDASGRDAVEEKLKQAQLGDLVVKEKKKGFGFKLPDFGGGVPEKNLVVFTRQFATMIDAGLPLVQCLDILGGQQDHKGFKKIILAVKAEVEGGATLADSFRKHPKVFDELFVNLVAAGEVSGILDTILNRLATYIEKSQKLKRQVKGAMSYPITVMSIATIVIIILLWKVIPVFENMFKDFGGGALPAPTQFVINMSNFFMENIIAIFAALFGTIFAVMTFLKSEFGTKAFDAFILKVPIFGPVVRKVAVAKFTRTLGTMISSGVPILDAMEICAKTAGNKTIEAAILYTRERVAEGRTIADPLTETGVFPSMVVQMISVGESTGAMDQMLNKIADFYDEEVDVAVAAMTSMMEPLFMMFLGGIVGGLIVSMYMPIFELAGAIKGD
ncbi:MAG: type II secretion system F family protein [Deltaproteobacteria bacterium]|nr:type II secretion system F family protein [Deltaproteobacteria bacterium]